MASDEACHLEVAQNETKHSKKSRLDRPAARLPDTQDGQQVIRHDCPDATRPPLLYLGSGLFRVSADVLQQPIERLQARNLFEWIDGGAARQWIVTSLF